MALMSLSSFESENLTTEKIDAMRRFLRRRTLWKILPVVEAVVAMLVLLSWLIPPVSAFEIAGEYLRKFSGGVNRGVFLFAVVNVLVAVIFYLSDIEKQIESDLYGQYLSSTASAAVSKSPATDEAYTSGDKQEKDFTVNADVHAVTAENKDITSSVGEQTNGAMKCGGRALTLSGEMVCVVSSAALRTARVSKREMSISPTSAKQDDKLKREGATGAIKSDGGGLMVRREMVRAISSVAGRCEMTGLPQTKEAQIYRRSISERLDNRQICRRRCDIDDLSSDEFRTTVETFIAGKKKMLLRGTFDA